MGAGLGLTPCGCHPYILNDFLTSNLCFVSRVQRARGVLRASTALVTPVDVTVRVPMSTEPQWAAGAWGCTETAVGAGQACRARAAAPSGHAFRLRRGPVGSADDPRTLEDLCGPGPPLPREPQSERTGGGRAPSCCASQSRVPVGVATPEWRLTAHVHGGDGDGRAGFVQRPRRKREIHIHARAIKYELYNFSDSKYQLNALFHLHLKPASHGIKRNGKIRANNLKLKFFFT